MIISPSILSADFRHLGDDVDDVIKCGADWIHFDVMDGHFVPNITFGIPVINSLRKDPGLFLDVHLMVRDPELFVDEFIGAGSNLITIHYESTGEEALKDCIDKIHTAGRLAGMSIKPDTPAEVLSPFLDCLDLILIMTVEPGFGGQHFRGDMMPKLRKTRELIGERKCYLEVDGGINDETVKLVVANGADTIVAGSYIFASEDRKERIDSLRIC